MEVPGGLYYTKEHEWARIEGEEAVIGITAYAQDELGDVVYVDLPKVGTELAQTDTFGAIESVKAVSDLYAPLSGRVLKVNEALMDKPETVNEDPYGEGWMIVVEIKDRSELEGLMNEEEYRGHVSKEK